MKFKPSGIMRKSHKKNYYWPDEKQCHNGYPYNEVCLNCGMRNGSHYCGDCPPHRNQHINKKNYHVKLLWDDDIKYVEYHVTKPDFELIHNYIVKVIQSHNKK